MSFAIFAVIVLPIAIIAVVVAILVRRRNAGSNGRLALVATRNIAVAYAGLTLVFTAISVIVTLVSDSVGVTIPVRQFWPEPLPWITIEQGPSAAIVDGGFTAAHVTASGLGMDARLLLAGGHALEGVTYTVIALVVALLCHRLLAGQPFAPALSRSIGITAGIIAAGGTLWQLLYGIGGSIASAQILTVTGWQSDHPLAETPDAPGGFDPFATGLPEAALAANIDFWPLFLGLALAAVAVAFRYGERLQRDTEGLV